MPLLDDKEMLLGVPLETDTVTFLPLHPAMCKCKYFVPAGAVILTAPELELFPAFTPSYCISPINTLQVLVLVPPESVTLLVYVEA